MRGNNEYCEESTKADKQNNNRMEAWQTEALMEAYHKNSSLSTYTTFELSRTTWLDLQTITEWFEQRKSQDTTIIEQETDSPLVHDKEIPMPQLTLRFKHLNIEKKLKGLKKRLRAILQGNRRVSCTNREEQYALAMEEALAEDDARYEARRMRRIRARNSRHRNSLQSTFGNHNQLQNYISPVPAPLAHIEYQPPIPLGTSEFPNVVLNTGNFTLRYPIPSLSGASIPSQADAIPLSRMIQNGSVYANNLTNQLDEISLRTSGASNSLLPQYPNMNVGFRYYYPSSESIRDNLMNSNSSEICSTPRTTEISVSGAIPSGTLLNSISQERYCEPPSFFATPQSPQNLMDRTSFGVSPPVQDPRMFTNDAHTQLPIESSNTPISNGLHSNFVNNTLSIAPPTVQGQGMYTSLMPTSSPMQSNSTPTRSQYMDDLASLMSIQMSEQRYRSGLVRTEQNSNTCLCGTATSDENSDSDASRATSTPLGIIGYGRSRDIRRQGSISTGMIRPDHATQGTNELGTTNQTAFLETTTNPPIAGGNYTGSGRTPTSFLPCQQGQNTTQSEYPQLLQRVRSALIAVGTEESNNTINDLCQRIRNKYISMFENNQHISRDCIIAHVRNRFVCTISFIDEIRRHMGDIRDQSRTSEDQQTSQISSATTDGSGSSAQIDNSKVTVQQDTPSASSRRCDSVQTKSENIQQEPQISAEITNDLNHQVENYETTAEQDVQSINCDLVKNKSEKDQQPTLLSAKVTNDTSNLIQGYHDNEIPDEAITSNKREIQEMKKSN